MDVNKYLELKYNKKNYNFKNDFKKAKIINITDNSNFDRQIIKISENEIVLISDTKMFYYEKKSEFVNKDIIDKFMKKSLDLKAEKDNKIKLSNNAAIVIGLKDIDNKYKTIVVKRNTKNKNEVFTQNNIILFRNIGLWEIGIKKLEDNTALFAFPQSIILSDEKNILKFETNAEIDYVTRDYISIKNIDKDGNYRYSIYNIDKLDIQKQLKIGEIAGDKGEESFLKTIKNELKIEDKNFEKYIKENKDNILTNIGIKREEGKFLFKTSVENEENKTKDLKLNIISVLNMFSKNEYKKSFTELKKEMVDLEDFYISNYENILLADLKNMINIYDIRNNEVEKNPFTSIEKKQSEKIVSIFFLYEEEAQKIYEEFKKTR